VAIHRFPRLKHLQRRGTQPDRGADGCSILERAIECLAADHHRSLQDAYGWLLQEAMAERVVVERLAWEVVTGGKNCGMPVSGDS
jgi:AmiR/NasT family two-component response regulator